MKFNQLNAMKKIVLYPNEAAKGVLVNGGTSFEGDKNTLGKNKVIHVFVGIFH
jgi:hypothetical protein